MKEFLIIAGFEFGSIFGPTYVFKICKQILNEHFLHRLYFCMIPNPKKLQFFEILGNNISACLIMIQITFFGDKYTKQILFN